MGRVGIEPTTPSFSWIEFYAENTLKLIRHIPLPVRAVKQSMGGILSALPMVDVTAGLYQPKIGAGEQDRTADILLGKQMLYH